MMPVNIDVQGRKVAVIGGGEVALRKAKRLLQFHAKVTVVSPSTCGGFNALAERITFIRKEYSKEQIAGSFMAIAAAGSTKVNESVSRDCREMGILCSRSDASALGDFEMPAVLKRGSLVISVSTSGCSPALSARIIDELGRKYTNETGRRVELMGRARRLILESVDDEYERKKMLRELVDMEESRIEEVVCRLCKKESKE